MKINPFYNSNLKINLGGTLSKNSLGDKFVRPARRLTKSLRSTIR